MKPSHDAFVALPSRPKLLAGVAGAAGFVVLGLWLAGVIGRIDDPVPAVGWLCVGFFGLCAVGIAWRLRQRGPMVRVDADGIWRWTRKGGALYRWAEIERVEEVRVRGQRFLAVWLADGRDPLHAAAFGPAPFGDVSVGVQGTDQPMAALVAAVERFAPG